MAAPIAMFALPKQGGEERRLKPVAIQCGQNPNRYPINTPPPPDDEATSSKVRWAMAKTVVQMADGNYHEAISHLGRTHLLVECFVLATYLELPETHPIRRLLEPHFDGTLFINYMAQDSLIKAGGVIDKIMTGSIDQSRLYGVIGAQSYQQHFNSSFLPDTLKQRGVFDPKVLPNYPFRDDALLIWQAIEQWTSSYVGIFYADDNSVLADEDLQNWLNTLTAHDGCRMAEIGEDGKLRTKAYLTKALTMVIFTASAGHAAVNFPQQAVMSYTPAMPLANYQPAPDSLPLSNQDWLNQLPSEEQSWIQLNVGTLLGSVYYTRLGEYPEGQFDNKQVASALAAFQAQLSKIEAIIKERDPEGTYPFLLPSRIPRSINI